MGPWDMGFDLSMVEQYGAWHTTLNIHVHREIDCLVSSRSENKLSKINVCHQMNIWHLIHLSPIRRSWIFVVCITTNPQHSDSVHDTIGSQNLEVQFCSEFRTWTESYSSAESRIMIMTPSSNNIISYSTCTQKVLVKTVHNNHNNVCFRGQKSSLSQFVSAL